MSDATSDQSEPPLDAPVAPVGAPSDAPGGAPSAAPVDAPADAPIDLDGIEADLAAVEVALGRLDAGDYWRDEATGAEIDDATLAADPTARRAGPPPVST